jgi:hypothetical protein
MVDVCVGKKHGIDFRRRNRKIVIHIDVPSLFQTAVQHDMFPVYFNDMAASRNLVVRSDKVKFHMISPLSKTTIMIECSSISIIQNAIGNNPTDY